VTTALSLPQVSHGISISSQFGSGEPVRSNPIVTNQELDLGWHVLTIKLDSDERARFLAEREGFPTDDRGNSERLREIGAFPKRLTTAVYAQFGPNSCISRSFRAACAGGEV
jgi:hypothetical protein